MSVGEGNHPKQNSAGGDVGGEKPELELESVLGMELEMEIDSNLEPESEVDSELERRRDGVMSETKFRFGG